MNIKRILRSIFPATRKDVIKLQLELQELKKVILRSHFIADEIHTLLYNDQNIRFYLPSASTDLVQGSIFLNLCFFEIELLEICLKKYKLKGAKILDAGANIGNHSIFLAPLLRLNSFTLSSHKIGFLMF